jgi:RimJ/RimL family protein N-acetyltransferase
LAGLAGGCGLGRRPSGAVEVGAWIARAHWGRGIASEACAALVEIARTLRLQALEASHFIDNPASGRVLEKLGFSATGIVAPRLCCARGEQVPARLYRLPLRSAQADGTVEPVEILAA